MQDLTPRGIIIHPSVTMMLCMHTRHVLIITQREKLSFNHNVLTTVHAHTAVFIMWCIKLYIFSSLPSFGPPIKYTPRHRTINL